MRFSRLVLADRTLRAYREILSQGGAILHFHAADVFLPRVRVEDLLIPSLEILEDPACPWRKNAGASTSSGRTTESSRRC